MAWPNKTAEAERIVANFMLEVNINTGDADIRILLDFPKKNRAKPPLLYTFTPSIRMVFTNLFGFTVFGIWLVNKGTLHMYWNPIIRDGHTANKSFAVNVAEAGDIIPRTAWFRIKDDMGIWRCRDDPHHFPTTSVDRCLVCSKSPTKGKDSRLPRDSLWGKILKHWY